MFNTRNEVLLLKQQNSLVDGNQGLQLDAQAAAIAAVEENAAFVKRSASGDVIGLETAVDGTTAASMNVRVNP